MYFAEFMVHGKMNLYCITHNSDEFYFFEREDGEIAELTNRATNYAGYAPVALQEIKDNLQEKREQYGRVKSLLQKSWKAVEGMDDNDMSRKKLINVVRDYHNDVCTDGGKCMVYEYNEKSDKKKLHFKILTGSAYYSTEKSDNQLYIGESYPCGTFEIGIGGEVDLERVMKDLSAEICFIYTPKYKSEIFIPLERMPINAEAYSTIEKSILTFSLGLVKRYCRGKIQPLVRGGIFVGIDMKMTENVKIIHSQYSTSNKSRDWGSGSGHVGGYIGVGVQMALNKQYVRLYGDLHKAFSNDGDMMKWGVTAEFGF